MIALDSSSSTSDNKTAVFLDIENIAASGSRIIDRILRDVDRHGNALVRRAYADWGRFAKTKHRLARLGFELVEMPSGAFGKNSADMALTVDALQLAFTSSWIDTFAIVSGDRDFIPLISKLRQLDRQVWCYARSASCSKLLSSSCNRLIKFDLPNNSSELVLENRRREPDQNDLAQPRSKPHPHNGEKSSLGIELAETLQFYAHAAWAIRVCSHDANFSEYRLDNLFHAVRLVNRNFRADQIAGTNKRPRVRLAKQLESAGLLRLRYDDALNHYMFQPGPLVDDHAAAIAAPDFPEWVEQLQHRRNQQQWHPAPESKVKPTA